VTLQVTVLKLNYKNSKHLPCKDFKSGNLTNFYILQMHKIIVEVNSFRTKTTKLKKDKIQPVLRRFKLRSCNFLLVEQTNNLCCYNIDDKIIQHRGSR
jgi:hypothetical protein